MIQLGKIFPNFTCFCAFVKQRMLFNQQAGLNKGILSMPKLNAERALLSW